MCLRFLVLVTLTLIWTHALMPRTLSLAILPGISDIVPRAPYELYQVDPKSIKNRQNYYRIKPYTTTKVRFKLKRRRKGGISTTEREVQQWTGIPAFLAWKISTSSSEPVTIPHAEEKVAVVVTAYVTPPDRYSYPKDSPEVDSDILLPLQVATYPVLHVAPIEPQEWHKGTAVWAYILHSLNAVAQDNLQVAQVHRKHFKLILAIAWANPTLSQMLYYKVDPKTQASIGFLLRIPDKFHDHSYAPGDHATLVKVVNQEIHWDGKTEPLEWNPNHGRRR